MAGPVLVAICWPAVVLTLAAATIPLAGELSSPCGTSGNHTELWAATSLLCLVMFALSVVRVFVGRSPWPLIDRIGTALLVTALSWAGIRYILFLYFTMAFSTPSPLLWFGSRGQPVLAAPALIPVLVPMVAIIVTRLTERQPVRHRIWALAGITVGLPLVWIFIDEVLSAIVVRAPYC